MTETNENPSDSAVPAESPSESNLTETTPIATTTDTDAATEVPAAEVSATEAPAAEVTGADPAPEPAASEPEAVEPEPVAAEPVASEPDAASAPVAAEPEPEPEPTPEPTPEPEAAEPAAVKAESAPEPEAAEPAAAAAAAAPEPVAEETADPAAAADDADADLGLPEAGALLGPPNLGGYESGEIVTGTILTVTKREAEVDLGNGKIGVVGDRHWSSGTQVDLTTVAKTGDEVEAAVLARADAKKRITLSRLWAQQKKGWETAEAAAKDKSDLAATVTSTVKGGLSLDVHGLRGFMPASLADLQTVNDLSSLVGQTFDVRVIEADRTKARLIVSRKAAMRASQRQQARTAMSSFEVGQTHKGVVAQITDFGAFIDVAGVRGLAHKSEIGWSRARDPQRELKVGQEVEVRVLKVQPSKNRLGLSMRLGDDPLRTLSKGDRFEGTVTRLADFGAFVALPDGPEGLVHVSEMAEHRVFAPEEIVIPGDKVWVKVLKIDRKRRTIDLSIAQAVVPDPPEEEAARAAEKARNEASAQGQKSKKGDNKPAAQETDDTTATSDDHAEDAAGTDDSDVAVEANDDHAEDGPVEGSAAATAAATAVAATAAVATDSEE